MNKLVLCIMLSTMFAACGANVDAPPPMPVDVANPPQAEEPPLPNSDLDGTFSLPNSGQIDLKFWPDYTPGSSAVSIEGPGQAIYSDNGDGSFAKYPKLARGPYMLSGEIVLFTDTKRFGNANNLLSDIDGTIIKGNRLISVKLWMHYAQLNMQIIVYATDGVTEESNRTITGDEL